MCAATAPQVLDKLRDYFVLLGAGAGVLAGAGAGAVALPGAGALVGAVAGVVVAAPDDPSLEPAAGVAGVAGVATVLDAPERLSVL